MPRSRRRLDRYQRMLRAMWRDTSALLTEFRRPILAFALAVFVGGWVYGELLVIAGYPRIPYVDLPYIMLSLMVLETTTDIPPEPYLIAFWYAMPVIAIYIIGRGAADFVRLFFNRGARRSAWEEAVASTYRNHVIVLGVGHVGLWVIRTLTQMGFEVVAIDLALKEEVDNELSQLGVPAIIGDGRHPTSLDKAGLAHAQAIIICTSNDHLNLECTMRVRDINPNVRIVVRMWDDAYAAQLNRFLGVETVLSASDLAAPAFAGAAVGLEITQTLRVHGEDYSMIRLKVRRGSVLDGGTIDDLQHKHNMDIVLHERDGRVEVHPEGSIPVKAGDTLVIFAHHNQIVNIATRNGAVSNPS